MKADKATIDLIEQAIRDGTATVGGMRPHTDEDASEKEFQADVVLYARQRGWWGYHTYDSRRCEEGMTDWIFARDRIIFVELKSMTGKLTLKQMEVIDRLRKAGGEVYVWQPVDWNRISEVLNRRANEP